MTIQEIYAITSNTWTILKCHVEKKNEEKYAALKKLRMHSASSVEEDRRIQDLYCNLYLEVRKEIKDGSYDVYMNLVNKIWSTIKKMYETINEDDSIAIMMESVRKIGSSLPESFSDFGTSYCVNMLDIAELMYLDIKRNEEGNKIAC